MKEHHTISPDGYNVGRDDLVRKATAEPQKFLRDEFTTTVIMLEGLLPLGAQGVNHGMQLQRPRLSKLMIKQALRWTERLRC